MGLRSDGQKATKGTSPWARRRRLIRPITVVNAVNLFVFAVIVSTTLQPNREAAHQIRTPLSSSPLLRPPSPKPSFFLLSISIFGSAQTVKLQSFPSILDFFFSRFLGSIIDGVLMGFGFWVQDRWWRWRRRRRRPSPRLISCGRPPAATRSSWRSSIRRWSRRGAVDRTGSSTGSRGFPSAWSVMRRASSCSPLEMNKVGCCFFFFFFFFPPSFCCNRCLDAVEYYSSVKSLSGSKIVFYDLVLCGTSEFVCL